MLKKEKKKVKEASLQLMKLGQRPPSSARGEGFSDGFSEKSPVKQNGYGTPGSSRMNTGNSEDFRNVPSGIGISQEKQRHRKEIDAKVKKKILGDMSVGRQEAFEIFRRDYDHNDAIEENKQTLKDRYAEAKSLGEAVNKSRQSINHLKSQIEHHRMSMAMQGLTDPSNPEPDEQEMKMRHEMENQKSRYKEAFTRLRGLKTEIEHLQHLLEKSKVKLMKDFELWWAEQVSIAQQENNGISTNGRVQNAWQTPPSTTSSRRDPSPAPSDRSTGSHKLGRLRGSIAGNLAANLRTSNSADGRIHSDESQREDLKSSHSSSGLRLTGDPQADADIMAFVRARQNIIQHTRPGRKSRKSYCHTPGCRRQRQRPQKL